jgi:hypothetical protein
VGELRWASALAAITKNGRAGINRFMLESSDGTRATVKKSDE